MNREDLDACTNRPDCPAREHVMGCPSDLRRAEAGGLDSTVHMTPTDPGLLTPAEHDAIAMTAELWALLCAITTDGPARDGDLRELIFHIHGIQRAVLKQAAARAYPELYRLLGGDPPPGRAPEFVAETSVCPQCSPPPRVRASPVMPPPLPDPVISYPTMRGAREQHQRCLQPALEVEDWGSPGDVRRCPHGRVQLGFEVLGTVPCYWRDLSPIFTPILYRRAVRALEGA